MASAAPPSRACLEAALEVFTREHFAAEHARTQGYLGHLRFPEHDWDGALAAYTAAIAATEDVLGTVYTESGEGYQIAETSLYFMHAAYCLVELDRADEALVMLDRGKGRALALDLSVGVTLRAAARGAAGEALAAAGRRHAELEALMREPSTTAGGPGDAERADALRAAKAELDRLLADSGVANPSDLDLDGILDAIPPGGAMVALLVTSEGSVAFVLPAGTAAVAYIPDRRVIGLSKIPRVVDMYARRLQIQERFTQHRTGYRNAKGQKLSSSIVEKYGRYLRPSLYQHIGPLSRDEALEVEKGLTLELRRKGYAVWSN